jgi:mono/diheme cytochrome c family protein
VKPNVAVAWPSIACNRVAVFVAGLVLAWATFDTNGIGTNDAKRAGDRLTFERDVRPILKAHCFHCHGEGEKLSGGVDLRLRRLMLTNSESGPVMVPGRPEESVLLAMVASGEMPKGEKKLDREQIARLEAWIREGAATARAEPEEVPRFFITEEERAYWAFQPVRRGSPPVVLNAALVRTPLDAFLLARLEASDLTFAPTAGSRALLRRVSFDLTGLPPTPEELKTFLDDSSPEAYEHAVDRLLASPRYGERWARHWLDVAGYADSNGGTETDSERPWAWRYRDYVIRSFNADKPFSQFIVEQLAGDELLPPPYTDMPLEKLDPLIATAFLRLAPDPTGDGAGNSEQSRNQVIADTLQIVSSSLLGLTVQCAQCHDHRYDPIPQRDYYRLRAVFEPAFDWKRWKNPGQRLVSLMAKDDRELAACIEYAARGIDQEAQRMHDELIEKFVQNQLQLVPAARREAVMTARKTPAGKRTEEHKKILREFPTFQDHIILGEVDGEGNKRVLAARQRATEVRATKPIDPMIHCLVEEAGGLAETHVFHRGDHQQPREKIEPGELTVLGEAAGKIPSTNAALRTTGRRLAWARMLTSGHHPLTARVLVNRVWHHYFGAGLVSTLGDFGQLGERPTHPELLDWLADEFVERGWRLKALHRLIVTSGVYRQGSVHPASQRVDPDNRLLGRMRLRRLDSESVRDSMLAVCGRLNPAMFGAGVPVAINAQGQVVVGSQARDGNGDPTGVGGLSGGEFRRSLYVQVRRTMPLGVMETFDTPSLSPNCEARAVSTVAPQALLLLNDGFVLERSTDLAERIRRERPGNLREQLVLLWQLLFAVEPNAAEVQRSVYYLAEQTETVRASAAREDKAKDPSLRALASLCQALLGSNRFLYLE